MCRWTSNGSGWGAIAIQRTILEYAYSFSNVIPMGSISQISTDSLEYVYVRGGSRYHVGVEGNAGVAIVLHTAAYTIHNQTIDIKTEVTRPQVDLLQRPTTDTIKSQITLDGFGISVFGKKIDFTGQVTFNSLNSALQSTINDKASNTQLTTLRNSLKDMAYQDMVTLAKLDTTIIDGGHIKTSLIDANAIVTGALVADRISTTDITTGRLTVTTGAKIGGFKIDGDKLTSTDEKGSLEIGEGNGVRFLRINEYGRSVPSTALLQIRNDKGSAVSLSGGSDKSVLSINGNGALYAIESYGSHKFYQRAGETWNAPGVLWVARILGDGTIEQQWGDGAGKRMKTCDHTGTGKYTIYHYLGHTDYYGFITAVGDWGSGSVLLRYDNYCTVEIYHPSVTYRNFIFNFMIVGRNKNE